MSQDSSGTTPAGVGINDPATPADDGRCQLKELAAELRNHIFSLATIESRPIELRMCGSPHLQDTNTKVVSHSRRQLTGLSLSSTCRQFREEVAPVFYAANTFRLDPYFMKRLDDPSLYTFPFDKTAKLMIKVIDMKKIIDMLKANGPTRLVDSHTTAYLGVERLADNTLRIGFINCDVRKCTCELEEMTRTCQGEGCVSSFIRKFRQSKFMYMERRPPACGACGQTRCG